MPRNPKQASGVDGPRVRPVEPPYDADTTSALEALGPPIALFRAYARRPDRARAMATWGRYCLSRRLALSLRHRELVIDRTTALCRAEYEWGVHVAVYAAKAGLTPEQLHSLALGHPDDPCWDDRSDRAVLTAVDALHHDHDLDDATWHDLVSTVGEDGAVDLVLLAGWYHAISFTARALRLPHEPGSAPLPGAS